jgi:replicative DNA helicase
VKTSLPNSLDAEYGILSCLIHNNDLINYTLTLIDEDTFHDFGKYLYLVLLKMYDQNIPIEELSLRIYIGEERELDDEEKILLDSIIDFVPIPTHYSYYLGILREKRALKELVVGYKNIELGAYKTRPDVNLLVDELGNVVKEARRILTKKDEIFLLKDLCTDVEKEIQSPDKDLIKVKTGIRTIDNIIKSVEEAEVFIIAARPSVGKTSLLIEILIYLSLWQNIPSALFSLEMPTKQIIFRIIQSLSMVNLRDNPTKESWKKLGAALSLMTDKDNIFIDDTASLDISELRRRCKVLHNRGVKVVGIDYIQLMTAALKSKQNRENELSYISAEIKGIAKDYKLRMFVLAQLNRKPEQRKNRKPLISDLRESGSLEQDADIIGLLHKDNDDNDKIVNCNLSISKNRNGETGNANLTFIKHVSKFVNPF